MLTISELRRRLYLTQHSSNSVRASGVGRDIVLLFSLWTLAGAIPVIAAAIRARARLLFLLAVPRQPDPLTAHAAPRPNLDSVFFHDDGSLAFFSGPRNAPIDNA